MWSEVFTSWIYKHQLFDYVLIRFLLVLIFRNGNGAKANSQADIQHQCEYRNTPET